MILLNKEKVNVTKFPDKTSQVWQLSDSQIKYIKESEGIIKVEFIFEDESEVFHLCQLSDLIHEIYYFTVRKKSLSLILRSDFLPYSRQDKDVNNNATFALTTFVNLITEFYDRINTIDVHSNKFPDEIISSSPILQVFKALHHSESEYVVYPDEGACSRYSNSFNIPFIVFEKVRDQITGNITGIKVKEQSEPELSSLSDTNVLIIDDICDGGRTFIECSKVLDKEYSPKSINLYVSHGIFSKGTQVLYDANIKNIYTKEGLVDHKKNSF